jgi:hypothetical protein
MEITTTTAEPHRTDAPEWQDWRWHLVNAVQTLSDLRRWIDVSPGGSSHRGLPGAIPLVHHTLLRVPHGSP